MMKDNVLTMTRGESGQEIRRAVGEIVARTDKEQVGNIWTFMRNSSL